MPRIYPVKNRIKVAGHIPFGGADSNAKYGRHSGDDSANPTGTDVYAPTDGVVTSYKYSQYHGNIVEIFDGTDYPHSFHLSQRLVNDGQRVTAGQLVGKSGNTGLSTGPHIHFGVSKKSVPNTTSFNDFIDPMEWLKQGEEMIQDTDNEYNRWRQLAYRCRARNLGRDEFRNSAVGLTWLRTVEILLTGEESDKAYTLLETGILATKDNWQGQIYGLLDQVKLEQSKANQLSLQVKDLQTQLAVQSDDTKLLNGFSEWLQKLIVRLGLKK